MKPIVVLDSTPLGLILQRQGMAQADECRDWIARQIAARVRLIVPEIVDYEVRRELVRLGKARALATLDKFNSVHGRFLPINSAAMTLAAELWAKARRQGTPTADRHALDIDAILAAQVLSYGLAPSDFVVATSNVAHLTQFVPAEEWSDI